MPSSRFSRFSRFSLSSLFSPSFFFSLYPFMLFLGSLAIVALGQPSICPYLGPLAATCGLMLFWRILLPLSSPSKRFWLSTAWYTAVSLVQFSWMLSHPFKYIYILYPLLSLFYGVQWGVIGLLITPKRVAKPLFPLFIAAVWTFLEWSRLFILTGSPWNPIGLFLTTTPYTLQMASWVGVYGLSFWVAMTNATLLQALSITPSLFTRLRALSLILFPYLLGISTLLYYHNQNGPHNQNQPQNQPESVTVLLVQPAFPIEEWLPGWGAREAIDLTFTEWEEILRLIAPYQANKMDLAILPENVVPFGAYFPLYRHNDVKKLFAETLGSASVAALPPLALPLAHPAKTEEGIVWVVSHSYILQGLSNHLGTGVVAGLEDRVIKDGHTQNTASAFYFTPQKAKTYTPPEKYDKRILVPGEYIPFDCLKSFFKGYGIQDSITPGKHAKTFLYHHFPFGLSICYEETYGHTMRDNGRLGARFLVNLTNDGWYPRSRLSEQHFEHARLRTVEMGIPLVRATNTGVTASVDHLGRVIDQLQDTQKPGALLTTIPLHHYTTLYTYAGDWTILFCSLLSLLAYLFPKRVFTKSHLLCYRWL